MTSKAFHWCPNGCGKKVICTMMNEKKLNGNRYKKVYECQKCQDTFKKEELD